MCMTRTPLEVRITHGGLSYCSGCGRAGERAVRDREEDWTWCRNGRALCLYMYVGGITRGAEMVGD